MDQDSKLGLNMGSSSGRVFVADLKGGIVELRSEMRNVKQDMRDLLNMAQQFKSTMSSIRVGRGEGEGFNPNQVAPDPVFTPPASATGVAGGMGGAGGPPYYGQAALPGPSGGFGGNLVAYTPNVGQTTASAGGTGGYTGNTNLTSFIKDNPAAGVLFASNLVSGMVNSPADSVEAQLLMQRAAFFNSSSLGGNIGFPVDRPGSAGMGQMGNFGDYNKIVDLVTDMARGGMVTDKFDTMRALAAAQSLGITGPNITQGGGQLGSVAMGTAAVSNLLPGIGVEGSMRAFSSMQQPRNVNMLRGIGIRLRDEQGNLKPPDQIIEDLWQKICRDYGRAYGTDKKPSEQEVLIGLQPGNSIDSMLDLYFGNDPMAKQLIANGLLFKAKGGGTISRDEMTRLGGTTPAANLFADIGAESTRGQAMYAGAGAGGYMLAGNQLLAMGKFMNDFMPSLVAFMTGANAFVTTLLGAGGESLAKLFKLAIVLKALPGRADGGPVGDQQPYVVGEKGPELFIPKSDGVIIPNHLMETRNRHEGGGVLAGGHSHGWGKNPMEKSQVENILRQAGFKGKGLRNAMTIVDRESGYNALAYNPIGRDDSYGLFQINMENEDPANPNMGKRRLKEFGLRRNEDLYDPLVNAKIAYKMSNGGDKTSNWGPWSTKKYLPGGTSDFEMDSLYESSGDFGKMFAAFEAMLGGANGIMSVGNINTLADIFGSSGSGAFSVGGTEAGREAQKNYNYGGVTINVKSDNPEKTARLVLKYLKEQQLLEKEAKK